MHRLPEYFLEDKIRVLVVGCGGTGSAIASGLVYLHHALIARGHPHGLRVTVQDGDVITAANCVRQPFSVSDIGLNKAVLLVTRINAFWGLDWHAEDFHLVANSGIEAHIVIGCVDTRAARRTIEQVTRAQEVNYWLDLGNRADDGQFLLGQPPGTAPDSRRLRTIAEEWPELLDPKLDDDTLPSCSALEALTRQGPFINQVLANHALALLSRLFLKGETLHRGAFVNLVSGRVAPIFVPPAPVLSIEDEREIRMCAASGCAPEVLMDAFGLDEVEFRQITARRNRAA
ncbi:MAG: PRTRC system ThiF family protein [Longimicrobiales bacterium]